MKIEIEDNIIGSEIIKKCCQAFIENDNLDFLELEILSEPIKLDFTLIGYFLIFKSLRPKFSIVIKLKNDTILKSNDNNILKLKYKEFVETLRQYRFFSEVMYKKEVFKIQYWKDTDFADEHITKNDFITSESFILPLLINEESYKELFETPNQGKFKYENIKNDEYLNKLNEKKEKHFNSNVLSIKFDDIISDFVELYFTKAIDKINSKSKPIEEDILQVLKTANEGSISEKLIFSLIIIRELKVSNRKLIKEIWAFTQNIVHGIKELSKNIYEHSGSNTNEGIGALIIRIYKKDDWQEIFELGDDIDLAAIYNMDEKSINSYINIEVIDLGQHGIVPKLLQNIESKKNEEKFKNDSKVQTYFQKDIEIINNGFSLKNLLLPEDGKILLHQAKRSIAHFGLIIFSNLIKKNEGLFIVSTKEVDGGRECVLIHKNECFDNKDSDTVPFGTNYKIVLPIVKDKKLYSSHYTFTESEKQTSIESISGIESMLGFMNIDSNSAEFHGEIIKKYKNIKPKIFGKSNFEIELINSENNINESDILLIDFENIVANNESNLYRLLASIEEEYPKKTTVIYNVKVQDAEQLYNLCKLASKTTSLPFWNKDSCTLIYSYEEIDKRRFYFSDVLWGDTEEDFLAINNIAHNAFYNSITINHKFHEPSVKNNKNSLTKEYEGINLSHLHCFDDVYLLPMDLIIKHKNYSLFEHNARVLLMKNIVDVSDTDRNDESFTIYQLYISEFKGFKISNTHFKLGSKIHISDFYYAKRFFQNSFYSSRFAFLVARQILKNFKIIEENESLTLIGYGEYSSLLMSQVALFMEIYFGDRINYNIIYDTDPFKAINDLNHFKINKNVQIIVPIASTYSTSLKIIDGLKEKYKKEIKFTKQDLNLISVYHSNDKVGNKLSTIEMEYGIELPNLEEKFTKVYSYSLLKTREQRFFIGLPSNWHKATDCELCGFSVEKKTNKQEKQLIYKFKDELPLYMTDETSVTPSLVFELPIKRDDRNNNGYEKEIILRPEHIQYGHFVNKNNHYNIYFNVEKISQDNKKNINEWLYEIRPKLKFDKKDDILIIASSHTSNTWFINIVNKTLFSSSATIIHFDPSKENIQNFKLIYGATVSKASKIYFLDDVLTTGTTFIRVNFYLNYISDYNRPFDGCIIMINRANQYNYDNIVSKVVNKDYNQVFSFLSLQLPTLRTIDKDSVLEEERKRYLKLSSDAVLNTMKNYFDERSQKLSPKSTNGSDLTSDEAVKNLRAFRYAIASHSIYDIFTSAKTLQSFKSLNSFLNEIKSIIYKQPILLREFKGEQSLLDEKEWDIAILKALSHYPFKNHKPLRDFVAKYIDDIFIDGSSGKMKPSEFKAKVSWAVMMDSNYLLNTNFLTRINSYFKQWKPSKTDKKKMIVFLVGKYKELLEREESRSFYLEKVLLQFEKSLIQKNTTSGIEIFQLIRMLIVENNSILKSIFYLKENEVQELINHLEDNKNEIQNIKIRNYFEFCQIAYSKEIIKEIIPKCYDSKKLLEDYEKPWQECLKELFDNIESILGGTNFASFMLVRYGTKIISKGSDINLIKKGQPELNFNENRLKPLYHLVYNKYHQVDENISSKPNFIINFLDGSDTNTTPKIFKTIIEYEIDTTTNNCKDLYGNDDVTKFKVNFFPIDCNRLLLIRIGTMNEIQELAEGRHLLVDKGQAVIGFAYNSKEDEGMISPFRTRLVLYLRTYLSRFINRHFENSQFKEFIEFENRKKLANLAGHGREMLLSISKEGLTTNTIYKNKFSDIFLHLEHIQLLMQFDNLEGDLKLNEKNKKFDEYYKCQKSTINKEYFDSIRDMAAQMMAMPEIEIKLNETEMAVSCSDFIEVFSFAPQILDIILFELIINAKKNRYLFEDDNKQNKLKIEHKLIDEILEIKVSNTFVYSKVSHELNVQKNYEYDHANYGLKLIKSLLLTYKLGTIIFDEKLDSSKGFKGLNLGIFTATLRLNPNPESI